MLDLFPEGDVRKWKLFISYPSTDTKDYDIFIERMSSATEAFEWDDITDMGDNFARNIDSADVLMVLSGLWSIDKELIMKHVNYAKTFETPIIAVRPYGAEEIPPELQEVATKVVGWNTACIVDAILLSINGDDYEFLM